MRPYWCRIPEGQAPLVLRYLEDALIREYVTLHHSSHEALIQGYETIVELVSYDTYWKYKSYHEDEVEELDMEFNLTITKFVAWLEYLASE